MGLMCLLTFLGNVHRLHMGLMCLLTFLGNLPQSKSTSYCFLSLPKPVTDALHIDIISVG